MGMVATQTDWTVDRLQAIPWDGNRHEIVEGALLVTPAPSAVHQRAVVRLAVRLEGYLQTHSAGVLFLGPGDVAFDDRTLVQPDLFVTPLNAGVYPRSWGEAGRPLLTVEVISPSSAGYDRGAKRRLYQREEIPEYWIVDTDARLVERWHPEDKRPEILADRIVWQVSPAPALEIDLGAFWGEV